MMFDQLFNVSPDAIIMIDADGRIVLANPQAQRLFGYPESGLLGLSVEMLMPASMRHRHRVHRAGFMANPRVRPMGATAQTLTGKRLDGSEFPVEIALGPIHTEEGMRYLASIRDISETQRARQALVRARYDSLVAQIGQLALASTDEDTTLGRLPDDLVAALGVEAVVVVFAQFEQGRLQVRAASGLDDDLELAPPWSLADDDAFGQVMLSGRPLIVADLSNSRDLRSSARLIEAGFGSCVLAPLLDRSRPMGALVALSKNPNSFDHDALHCLQSIANLLSALIQRRRTEDQLAHAQRLEAIGQLTGGIAHDFNNMLTVVSGNLQLLEMECQDNPSTRSLIDSAQRAAGHGAALTGKLLAFARRQRLQPSVIEPGPMLQSLGAMLQRTLGETVHLEIAPDDTVSPIYADSSQLESALLNLAINARDAMPRGGRLSIAVRQHDVDTGDESERLELQAGRYAVFTIADTGHGMAPEVLAHAFEPFFTTKEVGKGNGLGLSMVYGFVRQSGGQVRADSRLGYGTRIELFLPAARHSDKTVPEPAAMRPSDGNEIILVVEDEPAVRDIAVAFLRSLGYRVLAAAHAEEATRLLADVPGIALLFSDVALGSGMNGAELAAVARERRPGLPVLLTSGYEHLALAHNAGPTSERFELLRKPYRREALAAAVRRQLDPTA